MFWAGVSLEWQGCPGGKRARVADLARTQGEEINEVRGQVPIRVDQLLGLKTPFSKPVYS